VNTSNAPLRIFIIHASHNLTNHAASGDGLVAWGYIAELARAGHRIHAVTDRLDVVGPIPPNLSLIEVPRRHKNAALHYLSYMATVRRLYRRLASTEGVDVVHQMNPVVRGLSLALIGIKVPIVLGTYVGDWIWLRSAPNYRPRTSRERVVGLGKMLLDALQQSQAAAVALATPNALSRVPLSFTLGSRIRYLHHGVDADLFSSEAREGDPATRPSSILFLGTVRYHKGALTLIDAFRRVAAEMPAARLVFVGSGLTEEMRDRLAGYGLADRAEFIGSSSRAQVAGWLRACTVLCAPSFGEPYGQNILEAMASGKPVVATSEGGHRYLVDTAGGVQIVPGDTGAFVDALLTILRDPVRAQQMGAHNRAVVERRHAWPRVAGELEQIYRSVSPPPAGGAKSPAAR
jgi:glycosyltransferase involved in cell wall biosynthesis